MFQKVARCMIFIFTLTSCNGNVLKEMASTDSTEALYEEALKLVDAQSYDAAFEKLEQIEAQDVGFAATDRFKKTKGSVQAGQCGLNFINFIEGLSNASAANAFKTLMAAFMDIEVNPDKCMDAQTTMESMSAVTDDQLMFMAVLGMTKVGVNLRDHADRDGSGSLGDGSQDATFDSCDSTDQVNRLTDADLKQVITGLGLTLQNFALIGGSFSGSSAEDSLGSMQDFCDDPAGDGTGPGQNADAIDCQITDPASASLTPQLLRAFRRILKTSDQGLGTASPGCNLNPIDPAYCCPGLATP